MEYVSKTTTLGDIGNKNYQAIKDYADKNIIIISSNAANNLSLLKRTQEELKPCKPSKNFFLPLDYNLGDIRTILFDASYFKSAVVQHPIEPEYLLDLLNIITSGVCLRVAVNYDYIGYKDLTTILRMQAIKEGMSETEFKLFLHKVADKGTLLFYADNIDNQILYTEPFLDYLSKEKSFNLIR